MKKILFVLFSVCFYTGKGCECNGPAKIITSYEHSAVIFYGKYLGADTVENFMMISGKPLLVDNFEIIKVYKGISQAGYDYIKDNGNAYKISLIHNSSSCGIEFQKGAMYLVYTYRESYGITTGDCSRTRQIANDYFVSTYSLDPDSGKDENQELEMAMKNDTNERIEIYNANDAIDAQIAILSSQLAGEEQKVMARTRVIYIISAVSLIIISFLVYRLRKRK